MNFDVISRVKDGLTSDIRVMGHLYPVKVTLMRVYSTLYTDLGGYLNEKVVGMHT